jgi:hypothetical protein
VLSAVLWLARLSGIEGVEEKQGQEEENEEGNEADGDLGGYACNFCESRFQCHLFPTAVSLRESAFQVYDRSGSCLIFQDAVNPSMETPGETSCFARPGK